MKCIFDSPECKPGLGMTDHHLISQQRIRRVWKTLNAGYRRGGPKPWSLRRCLEDRRNMVRICWEPHHQRVENRIIYVEAHQLPDGFFDFVREYGLEAQVDQRWTASEAA